MPWGDGILLRQVKSTPIFLPISDPLWDLKTPHPQPLSHAGRGEQEDSDFTSIPTRYPLGI